MSRTNKRTQNTQNSRLGVIGCTGFGKSTAIFFFFAKPATLDLVIISTNVHFSCGAVMQMRKKNGSYPSAIGLCLSLILVMVLGACQSRVAVPDTFSQPIGVKKILVLPFKDMYNIYGDNVSYRCPLCGSMNMVSEVAEGATDKLTEHLVGLIQARRDLELIPPSQAEGAISGLVLTQAQPRDELALLMETGQRLDADGVLLGRIYRYQERKGGNYSVASPASVSFDLLLIRVSDKRLVWSANFDETQSTLFENLFHLGTFIKRKGQWVSADRMAKAGLEEMLHRLPQS